MEIERHPNTPSKVSDTAAWTGPVPFSTPFSAEIANAPHYGKVKMPIMYLYDGATDSKGHLGVYKVPMSVQDIDDAAYYRFFPATPKGVAQPWFNGLAPGSIPCL